jgi:hypothetical protein
MSACCCPLRDTTTRSELAAERLNDLPIARDVRGDGFLHRLYSGRNTAQLEEDVAG